MAVRAPGNSRSTVAAFGLAPPRGVRRPAPGRSERCDVALRAQPGWFRRRGGSRREGRAAEAGDSPVGGLSLICLARAALRLSLEPAVPCCAALPIPRKGFPLLEAASTFGESERHWLETLKSETYQFCVFFGFLSHIVAGLFSCFFSPFFPRV